MDEKVENLLEGILRGCPQKIFVKKVKQIKKNYSFTKHDTVSAISQLCGLLYIVDRYDLALEVAKLINHIPFKGSWHIWNSVSGVLEIEHLIHTERGEEEEATQSLHLFKSAHLGDDYAEQPQITIKPILRRLNGDLLCFNEIQEKQNENDLKGEITWRFSHFRELNFMRTMGGSVLYPVTTLEKMIADEKEFIAKHIDKALF